MACFTLKQNVYIGQVSALFFNLDLITEVPQILHHPQSFTRARPMTDVTAVTVETVISEWIGGSRRSKF